MHTVGPYRLGQALGTCPVGEVWSAAGPGDSPVTVTIINVDAARDPALRQAFAHFTHQLAQTGQLPMITGDFSAPAPWVATAERDGSRAAQIFVALGLPYSPATAGPDGPAVPPPPPAVPPPPAASPASPPPAASPASPPPAVPLPRTPDDTPPHGLPPVSGGGHPATGPADRPPPNPRRRTTLVVSALFLTVTLLATGGAVLAFTLRPDASQPEPAPPTDAAPPAATTAAPPSAPGLEPPLDGAWPDEWPSFPDPDEVTTMTDLAGVGFDFQVPDGWDCTSVTIEAGLAHYTCGPGGTDRELGGDLVVRTCPDPCDADRRVDMRRAEEAWGLQWVRDGGYRCWAETEEIDGSERYGLVLVGYWRSADEGRLDRQVVFRMTAPVDRADEIRRVANSVRDQIT